MPDLAKAGQLLVVDVDQVSRPLPLLTLNRSFGLKISQPPEPKTVKHPGHGGERSGQKPGYIPQVQPLMTEPHGGLLLLRIEHPPLVSANTASIHQRSRSA